MKQRSSQYRRRMAAFLAAAAFFSAPCFAQDAPAQEAQQPPVIAAPPVQQQPPAVKPPAEEAPEAADPAEEAPAGEAQPAERIAPRAAVRPRVAAPQPSAPVAARPATSEGFAPAPAPAPVAPPALGEPVAPLPTEVTVQPLPVPPADPVGSPAEAAAAERDPSSGSMLPWIIVGALVLGALALFAMRRRRPERVYRQPYRQTPVAAAPVAPAAAPAPVLREAQGDRPWLELLMQPARAGVEGDDAVVEFVLTVDNQGSAPAEDVRISTWMVAGGPNQGSDMERMLVEPSAAAALPSAIPAGEGRSIQTQVALPTGSIEGDSILPVVVADARYTLPDGSEGRTSASFAVGVPDGEELARFGIANPSGLHEGVIARPLGEPERA
ncbi:MAG TPA: hypothetical protein VF662_12445 [Allosphingosinicella sp.]|jgi:MYXO-CTERM domain-containing protein